MLPFEVSQALESCFPAYKTGTSPYMFADLLREYMVLAHILQLRNDDEITSTILLVLFHFYFVVKVFK